jgi:hypothetical protein
MPFTAFFWLRAFHPPLCVRLDIRSDTASITSKEGQFHGAAHRGKLLRTKTSLLPQSQVDRFLRDVAEDHFWTITSPNKDLGGPDGSEWILKAADHGTYKVLVSCSMFARSMLLDDDNPGVERRKNG